MLKDFDFYKEQAFDQDKAPYMASKAPKFAYEDTYLNWEKENNKQIFNRYRAFHGTNFTVRTKFNGEWYFINDMDLVKEESEAGKILKTHFDFAKPGSIRLLKPKQFKNFLYVKCASGWVEVRAGNFETKYVHPTHKFIEKHLNKEKMQADKSEEGLASFHS